MKPWGRWGAGALVAAALMVAGGAAVQAALDDDFPHPEHAGLFPLCTGCHEGIPTGDPEAFYPPPGLCAECHDGEELQRVEWAPPTHPPDNLVFQHPGHAAEVGARTEQELDCIACHAEAGAPRMTVELAVAERCFDCHAHEATSHYADARCETCHIPLAETRFTRGRIASLPEPPSHQREGFLEEAHGELARGYTVQCAICHTRELCVSCHVDPGRYPVIAALPPAPPSLELPAFEAHYFEPASHRQADWIERHGQRASAAGATCSTCHTRELCVSCHVDPGRYPVIAALPAAPPSRELPAFEVRYFEPASHRQADWIERHGQRASAAGASCSTCHTRESCTTCHAADPPAPVVALPGREETVAPGVSTVRSAPPSHETPLFEREHGTLAASGAASCSSCHTRLWCEACHNAPTSGAVAGAAAVTAEADGDRGRSRTRASYHPPNFVSRHPAEAWARTLECSSCHDTQAFCRSCHTQAGMTSSGRLGSGFHDAQPLWLLRHGQAARQGLESCASCHAQRDCMQCHSELGAFQISPHGPSFDPERFRTRNRQICSACHISDPFERRNP